MKKWREKGKAAACTLMKMEISRVLEIIKQKYNMLNHDCCDKEIRSLAHKLHPCDPPPPNRHALFYVLL